MSLVHTDHIVENSITSSVEFCGKLILYYTWPQLRL